MSVYPTSETANTIVNSAAAEVGLTPVSDPFSSTDKNFIQLTYLLNTAGREVSRMFDWQFLLEDGTVTIDAADAGQYDLPTDFLSLIAETMWDTTVRRRIIGPITPRQWHAISARNTTSLAELYVRIFKGQFSFYPHDPTGTDKTVTYQYKSAYWVDASDDTPQKTILVGTDVPRFDSLLMSRYLKLKWLSAKNLDTVDAQADFKEIFELITGEDVPGLVLDASGTISFPYLDSNRNIKDTGYGS